MQFRSILKPESSVTASAATAGTVFAIYNLTIGPVSGAAASDANHPALESSRKKAGYTAFVFVSALFLITKDGNIATFGYGSIVGMEVAYRHAIMVSPLSNGVVPPAPKDYVDAGDPAASNVTPLPGTYQPDDAMGY